MEQFNLPSFLFNRGDVLRLIREVNSLNDFFVGAAARQTGTAMQVPKTTRLLDQLAEANQINLLDASARKKLQNQLEALLQQAPYIHMSFASEPTPRTIEPILNWLRANIHPHILLQVGVQPSIAAGCIVRTQNKMFDMSIRTYLQKQAKFLSILISGVADGR